MMTRSRRVSNVPRIKASRRRSRISIIGHNGLIGADVQFDVSERRDRRNEEPRPPHHGPHPGDEILRLEGLAEIIIRAAVQASDHVLLGILGRQHDDSRPFRQSAQRCDDVERIAVNQHRVDDRRIVLEIAERLLGIRSGTR
jgi:hypothetical protein